MLILGQGEYRCKSSIYERQGERLKILRKICSAVLCAAVALFMVCSFAEGREKAGALSLQWESVSTDTVAVSDMLEGLTARSAVVTEMTTGRVLFEKEPQEQCECGHYAKLMVLLLTAEKIDCGELSMNDMAVVSEYANSQQGSQIWLDKGEKISVEELVKSVSIGNANDGCAALAEKVAGSYEEAVKLMNSRAKSLGMKDTFYTDCTGMDEGNVTTAFDTALLCSEVAKYKNLTPYLTCWLDNVRDGKAELVNLNRLVRTYKGITGMKAWGGEKAGSCIAATAEKGDMSVCVVLNGCGSQEDMNAEAKKLLELAFDTYELYTPELPDDIVKETVVCGGEELSVKLAADGLYPIVIPRGTYRMVECSFTAADRLDAPVKKGDTAGKIEYTMGGEVILSGKIVACKDVKKMNFLCGIKKLVYNLLSM